MIKDTHKLQGFNVPKMPKFKGHVKITLHNCKNGKNEVIEGDNIVTNAVRDILANNYLGQVDYAKLLPLVQKWFSGLLIFEQAHTLSPDNYYPQGEDTNHLWGHAGPQSIDAAHDDDLTRGNPVTPAFVFTEDTIKQVWEFSSPRANVPDGRYIRSLALTHGDVGNAGLGSNTYAFQNFVPFENVGVSSLSSGVYGLFGGDNIVAQYDDNHGLFYHIGDLADYYAEHIVFSTQKVSIYIRRMPFLKAGLYETTNGLTNYQTVVTVTTSITFYCDPAYYFDAVNKRLWLFTNATSTNGSYSKNTISYSILDLSDLSNVTEYAHGTIVSDVSKLAPLSYARDSSFDWSASRRWIYSICKSGNYFYFPTSNAISTSGSGSLYINCTGYQKINISNQSDQSSIENIVSQDVYSSPVPCGGLTANLGRVTNGSKGYSCVKQIDFPAGGGIDGREWSSLAICQPNNPIFYMTPIGNQFNSNNARYILAKKLLTTTLFNLPSPVQKTSSQSMTVEYTLQEVDGGSES